MKPIISPHIRLRYPELFSIGDDSIIDDFCYFSTAVQIGVFSHIANNCSVGGGKDSRFVLGDFCSLSAGVRIWCTSDDFTNDIVTILPPEMGAIKTSTHTGDVILGNYTAVGTNSVVMPGAKIPEGAVIGALSYVPPDSELLPWHVYVGTPVRAVKERNRKNVEEQIRKIEDYLKSARGGHGS